ncbi:MAG: hypothetical protein IH987_18815, partial [Planctomycetes bacterium]|nr:hypothetical protein [Planctomycetota bacterium]
LDRLAEVLLLLANEPPLPIDDTQVVAGAEVAREQLELPEVATAGIIHCAALLVHLCQREVHVGNRIVDLEGPDAIPGTGDEDLHLRAGSACVDAGSNDLAAEGIVVDFDGVPRFVDDPDTDDTGVGHGAIVDMGAFERQPGMGQPIPTVSSWGMLVLVLSVLVAGSIFLRNCGQSPMLKMT